MLSKVTGQKLFGVLKKSRMTFTSQQLYWKRSKHTNNDQWKFYDCNESGLYYKFYDCNDSGQYFKLRLKLSLSIARIVNNDPNWSVIYYRKTFIVQATGLEFVGTLTIHDEPFPPSFNHCDKGTRATIRVPLYEPRWVSSSLSWKW